MPFEAYVAQKTREAVAATLEPWTTVDDRHAPGDLAIGNAWSRALFDGDFYLSPPRPDDLPSTSLVFVESREGNTAANDPSALGGGHTDKHLIYEGLSRVAADAVLAGADTIRGAAVVFSVWHPELVALRASLGLPRHPVQAIATLRGLDLDAGLMFNVPDLRVVLLTVAQGYAVMERGLRQRPWITPIVMRDARNLETAFRELRHLGIARVSCVGGRTLARQVIDAGLVQDLYVTKSPKPGGEPDTPLYPTPLEAQLVMRKRGTGRDEGVVFEHRRPTCPS